MFWQHGGAALCTTETKRSKVTLFLCLGCHPEKELSKVSDLEVLLLHETTLPKKMCTWEEVPGSEDGLGRQSRAASALPLETWLSATKSM